MNGDGQKKKIVATIECRMTSTRLPGKVLLPLAGKPVLQVLVERLRKVARLDEIVLATTTNKTDDCIVELANKINCKYYRGSEEDVLRRVLEAAEKFSADIIVEITGDCPFIDPEVVSQTIALYLTNDCDYCSNDLAPSYPLGMDVQVFSIDALKIADEKGLTPLDREHVSYYIVKRPKEFRYLNLPAPPALHWPDLRLTLDEKPDYELLNKIQEHFIANNNPLPSLLEVINYLKANPHLVDINKNVVQKTF